MKLSKAQIEILECMGGGGIYYRFWSGVNTWGHWAGKVMGKRPIVNIRSIEKLQDLGLIEVRRQGYHHRYYGITDAGREQVESSPAGGR